MPYIGGRSNIDENLRRGWGQRIEVTGTITSEEHHLRWDVLDGKTKFVKFNSHVVITGKGANKYEIFLLRMVQQEYYNEEGKNEE